MSMRPFWFVSYREAADWLDFDCTSVEAEWAALSSPDLYAEWAEWANSWEINGEPDLDAVIVDAGGERA